MRAIMLKVATCLLCIACAFWYARSNFYRDPGRAFFDKTRAYEQRYSSYRKNEVKHYIESFNSSDLQGAQAKAGSNASLCVSLGSVRREHTQYLEVRDLRCCDRPPRVRE
jgi:hypothetical protein